VAAWCRRGVLLQFEPELSSDTLQPVPLDPRVQSLVNSVMNGLLEMYETEDNK
jgi:hypothetical protein